MSSSIRDSSPKQDMPKPNLATMANMFNGDKHKFWDGIMREIRNENQTKVSNLSTMANMSENEESKTNWEYLDEEDWHSGLNVIPDEAPEIDMIPNIDGPASPSGTVTNASSEPEVLDVNRRTDINFIQDKLGKDKLGSDEV